MFGSVTAPSNKGGRPRSLTPLMIQVLCDYLLEKPQLYLDEMVVFLWDESQVPVTKWSDCSCAETGGLVKEDRQAKSQRAQRRFT